MKNYIDVTKKWLDNAMPNTHKVKYKYYYRYKCIKYKVYKKEKEIAEW